MSVLEGVREDFLDPQARHAAPKRLAVDLVAVVEEIGWCGVVREGVPDLLGGPVAVERLVEGVQKSVHRLCSPSYLPIPGPSRADRRAVRRCPKLYRTRLRPRWRSPATPPDPRLSLRSLLEAPPPPWPLVPSVFHADFTPRSRPRAATPSSLDRRYTGDVDKRGLVLGLPSRARA
jgi:hypothetical protein